MTTRRGIGLAAQLAGLAAVAAVLAALAQAVGPRPLPWNSAWTAGAAEAAKAAGLRTLEVGEVRAAIAEGTYLLLDARPATEYAQGHLPGAMSVPGPDFAASLASTGIGALLSPDQPVLVYCSGLACEDSIALAKLIHGNGVTNAAIFPGGFAAWQAAGGEVQR